MALLSVFACNEEPAPEDQNYLLTLLAPEHTGVGFANEIINTPEFNIFNYRNFYNGGGVAIGDVDGDGLDDIYFTANMGPNKLYMNKGELRFDEVTDASIALEDMWSTGAVMVDINADDRLDIFVCNAGLTGVGRSNKLFINQGNMQFEDRTAEFGLDDNGYTTHAAFFDYDLDGDLDVYILNNSFIPVNTLNYSNKRELRSDDWPVKEFLKGGGDKLLRNDDGRFTDVSEQAEIYGSLIGFGLGVTTGDVNSDGYPDIYVSNDFFERDYLYINNQDGTFSEELMDRIDQLSHSSMGADIADINNDGSLEIFVTDMLPDNDYRLKTTSTFDNINLRSLKVENGFYNQFMHNTLQLNDGNGNFTEISNFSNVSASDWSWGALMFDVNNDSYNDLFVSNGILNDVIDQDFIDFFANEVIQNLVLEGEKAAVDSIVNRMPSVPLKNKLFINQGDLTFIDGEETSGINKPSFSNGAAYADLDNDGDYDLVVNNVNDIADIYENEAANPYVSFELSYKDENVNGIGSKIELHQGGQIQAKELYPSRGFQSSSDYTMIFGLGDRAIDSVIVIWPDQSRQRIGDVNLDGHNQISYQPQNSIIYKGSKDPIVHTKFQNVESGFDRHIEDDYIDFYYERNIPIQLSKEGPCAAVADINGDQIDDIYIGGSAGQAPQLYVSNVNGYSKHQQEYFERFKAFEDTAAEFFDCDGDGDLDLIVGSGGNNVTYINNAYRDRLYINNNGRYEIELNSTPPKSYNTGTIIPADFDSDGDMDLFIGSRSLSGEYGISPGSFILANNGKGQFLDVTERIVPELSLAGMITDAIWADIHPNEGTELLLVGEWMSPKVLSYTGARFEILSTELDSLAGWWQSVAAIDLDGDKDLDFVLGNLGTNFYLEASHDEPLFLWISDVDQNGSLEKIITQRRGDKDYPIITKRDLVDQVPSLKKENILHSSYANKAINELFTAEQLKNAIIKKINTLSSYVVINDGDKYTIEKLENRAQLSCINEMVVADVDGDRDEDIIIGGNNHFFQAQFSMLDAFKGEYLENQNGKLKLISSEVSGLDLSGVVRDLHLMTHKKETRILALINNERPRLFKLKPAK